MTPKVSFMTVSYKTPDLIRQLLNGVEAAQFAFPFEYFVVDNAVGDGTGEMIRERFPWVTVIDAPGNIGFAAGNNLAMRAARGDYAMLFNPDLTVFPGEMEKLLAYADAHPTVGVMSPRLLNPNRTLQHNAHRFYRWMTPVVRRTPIGRLPWGRRHVDWFHQTDEPMDVARPVDSLIGAAMLIRREVLLQIGGFDERFFMYFEDEDFCRRAWMHGWPVHDVPQSVFVHYHQRESVVRHPWEAFQNPVLRMHVKSALKYFWKYRGKAFPR